MSSKIHNNHKNINEEIIFPFLAENYKIDNCRFKAFFHNNKNIYSTPKVHHHNFYEIHFVKKGYLIYDIMGENIKICEGQYVIISPETKHNRIKCDTNAITYHLTYNLAGSAYKLSDRNNYQLGTISDSIFNNLFFIIEFFQKNASLFNIKISIDVFHIIYNFAAVSVENLPQFAKYDNIDMRIILAKQYIKDNILQNPKCEDVANHCFLSVKQLTRLFYKYESISLKSYISKQRIEEAMKLVSEQTYSFSQISDIMNFCNEYYFNKFFKTHSGLCPGEFRKTLIK